MEIQGCAGMTGETFRRLTGVRKRTFAEMVTVLEVAEAALKKQGGKPSRLTVEMRLRMTLEYWREYRTYLHIGHSYGGSESTASRNIRWCEDTLIMSGVFTLPGKTALVRSEKRHTLKTQLVVDKATGTIICLAHAVGRRHDFRVLKESGVRLHPNTKAMTDTGYLGLQKMHGNTTTPKKRSKKNPLNKADKRHNRTLSKDRVPAEHVIGAVKRFTIVSDRYRNRRKCFCLRLTLIAVAYNKNLMP